MGSTKPVACSLHSCRVPLPAASQQLCFWCLLCKLSVSYKRRDGAMRSYLARRFHSLVRTLYLEYGGSHRCVTEVNSRAGVGMTLNIEMSVGELKQAVINGEPRCLVPLQLLVVSLCLYSCRLRGGGRWLVVWCPGGQAAFGCDINTEECWYTEEKSGERGNPTEVGPGHAPPEISALLLEKGM